MANASTVGFGLRTTSTVGNTPATSGQSNYKIKSGLGVGIFKNNPISIQDSSGDEGYIQDASFATTDDGGQGGATFDNSGHAPLIGVGGLLLARIPEEIALQIDAYYKKQNDAKEEAVENNLMKEQHPSMKFQKESNTRVTFGGTKK